MKKIAAVLLLALAAAACGGDDADEAKTDVTEVEDDATDDTSGDTTDDTDDTVDEAPDVEARDLEAIILNAGDLADTFVEQPDTDDEEDTSPCKFDDSVYEAEEVGRAESYFADEAAGRQIGSEAIQYTSSDVVDTAFDEFVSVLEACVDQSEVDADGNETIYNVQFLEDFPQIGDRSIAADLVVTTSEGEVSARIGVAQLGDTVIMLSQLDLNEPIEAEATSYLLDMMVGRA